MFKIYLTDSTYQDIVIREKKLAATERSNLYKLLEQQPAKILTASENEEFKAHPENVLKNPTALYILDLAPSEALAIQRMYGVMCLSSSSPDISSLIDVNDEHTTGKRKPLLRGWDSVLDSIEHLPSNALILTDRYLFKDTNVHYGNGFDNVKSILTELLPQELSTTYHITIVFDKSEIDSLYDFDTIAKRLNDVAKEMNRSYPITMEVLGITGGNDIYYSFHNRRIVSNYFVVKMDHKLAAFHNNVGTTDQTIIPQVLFTEDSLNHRSSPPLESMQQTIFALRDFSKMLLSPSLKHTFYSYAVNGNRMEKCLAIRNRLIK